MWTGKVPGRGGVAYRAKEAKTLWFGVVEYFIGTAWFIRMFLAGSP